VVRFWNREILCDFAAVRERLVEEMAMCRRAVPSPAALTRGDRSRSAGEESG